MPKLIRKADRIKWLIACAALAVSHANALTLTTEELPPYNFSTDGGQTASGISSEVVHEILRRAEIPASINFYPWARAYNMALHDKDTCVYSTVRMASREKIFKWVGPILTVHWILYARSDSTISAQRLDDVKPYTIGHYINDAKGDYLLDLGGFKLDAARTEELTFKKLEGRRIDLAAATSFTGPMYAEKLGIKIKPVITFQEVQMYIACNPSIPDSEIEKMNAVLKAMRTNNKPK